MIGDNVCGGDGESLKKKDIETTKETRGQKGVVNSYESEVWKGRKNVSDYGSISGMTPSPKPIGDCATRLSIKGLRVSKGRISQARTWGKPAEKLTSIMWLEGGNLKPVECNCGSNHENEKKSEGSRARGMATTTGERGQQKLLVGC